GFERALEAAERFGALLLDAQDLLLGLCERLADRRKHGLDRLLARLQGSDRILLMLAQVLARELQKDCAVRAQRCAGRGIERSANLLHRALERRLPFALELLFALDLRLQYGELDVQRFGTFARAPRGKQRAEQEAQRDRSANDQQRRRCHAAIMKTRGRTSTRLHVHTSTRPESETHLSRPCANTSSNSHRRPCSVARCSRMDRTPDPRGL